MPRVAASERGRWPNRRAHARGSVRAAGVVGRRAPGLPPRARARRVAERHGKAGRSGLEPRTRTLAERAEASLSRPGHVKPGPKPGGPPSKPEHYPATDSERVP